MPGLVDTHIHAPQYAFTGTGYDGSVVEWLKKYTFPVEAKFTDMNVAHTVYRKVVVRNGPQDCCFIKVITCIVNE